MITLINVQSGISVKFNHLGIITSTDLKQYVRDKQQELRFNNDIEYSQITYKDKGKFKFLIQGWKMELKAQSQLIVKIVSYDHLNHIEELINQIERLKKQQEIVDQINNSYLKGAKVGKSLRVVLLYSNPLYIDIENNEPIGTQYQSKYAQQFYPLIKQLQISGKKISLDVEQLNKVSLEIKLKQKANILVINAHSEYSTTNKLDVYGQKRIGCLDKFSINDISLADIEHNSIDLIILHSSTSQQLGGQLLKFTKNLIVLSGNIYSKDFAIKTFLTHLFNNMMNGDSILDSYKKAFSLVDSDKRTVKNRCCCFHSHNNNCGLRNEFMNENQPYHFIKAHKKYHIPCLCECKNRQKLIHSSECQKIQSPINRNFQPRKIDNNELNYCCCIEISNKFYDNQKIDVHSFEFKIHLKKWDDNFYFELYPGSCQSNLKSNYLKTADILQNQHILSSRKKYTANCLVYIIKMSTFDTKKVFFINFYGEQQDKQLIAHYLYQVLIRKAVIQPKKQIINNPYKFSKIKQLVKSFNFIVIMAQNWENFQFLRQISADSIKIIVLITKQIIKFEKTQILSANFLKFTQDQVEELKKKHIKRVQSSYSLQNKEERIKTIQQVKKQIRGKNMFQFLKHHHQLLKLAIILSHFNSVSQEAYNLIIDNVKKQIQGNILNQFQQRRSQLFLIQQGRYLVQKNYKQYFILEIQVHLHKIQIICTQFMYELLLQQMIKITRKQQSIKQKQESETKLFDMTTVNKTSVLSLLLELQFNNISQNPVFNITQITDFIITLSTIRVSKINKKQFILLVILWINYQLVYDQNNYSQRALIQKIKSIKTIIEVVDPLLESILYQLTIQIRFYCVLFEKQMSAQESDLNEMQNDLAYWKDNLLYQTDNQIYKYISSFDVFLGYVLIYTHGFNSIQLKDKDQKQKLFDLYQNYERNRAKAYDPNKQSKYYKIAGLHGFKLNFVKILINNQQLYFLYQNSIKAPSPSINKNYSLLYSYFKLLKLYQQINHSPQCRLQVLWKWMNVLQKQYNNTNLNFFKDKTKLKLINTIKQKTQNVCYFLKYYPMNAKEIMQSKTAMVSYHLAKKIRDKKLVLKQLPLTKQSVRQALKLRCKYLILYVKEDQFNESNNQQLIKIFTEQQGLSYPLDMLIQKVIICSINLSESLKSLIMKSLNGKSIEDYYFKFQMTISKQIEEKNKESKQEMIIQRSNKLVQDIVMERKLQVSIFIEKILLQDQFNKHQTYRCHKRIFSVNNQNKKNIQIIESTVQKQNCFNLKHTDYTVYKGDVSQVGQIIKMMQSFQYKFVFNLYGLDQNLQNFLSFFQKVCEINLSAFPQGFYYVNCRDIKPTQKFITQIEQKLGHQLPWFINKKCLIVFKNFDQLIENMSDFRTFNYLKSIIFGNKFSLKLILTSSFNLDYNKGIKKSILLVDNLYYEKKEYEGETNTIQK